MLGMYLKSQLTLLIVFKKATSVADPDGPWTKAEGGGRAGFVLLARPTFLPSVISPLFIQNRAEVEWGGKVRPYGPLP